MLVNMWMTQHPLSIDPATSISKAALLMWHHRVRHLVVVEQNQGDARLAGIVSSGDIARAFPPDLNPTSSVVSESSVPQPVTLVMTRNVRTIAAGAAIEEAARVMKLHKIAAMPVMSGTRLVGILTESDIFRAFVEMSDAGTPSVRVTFELDEDEDVMATMVELCREHGARVASILSFHHRDQSTGDRRRLGVVRLPGTVPSALLDAIWRSHHRVLSVVREPAGT